jgi:hypothetical protein
LGVKECSPWGKLLTDSGSNGKQIKPKEHKVKKYWFVALLALAVGCKSPGHHHENYAQHPPGPEPGMIQPMPGMGPGMSPGIMYFNDASQKLAEGRRDGYLTDDQFADLLEKLMGDVRQIMVAEAESAPPVPRHPMPMHREHREGEHEDEKR